MKKLILLLISGLLMNGVYAQGVGINGNGALPHPSAGLDIDYTNRGFLPPRLTTAQRDAISNPAIGLMIYNTDNDCIEFYDSNNNWVNNCAKILCAAISATIVSTVDASCNGGSDGSAEVLATGGQTPYGYLWSSGATTAIASGLSAGSHTVTLTDNNGCTTTGTATVGEPTALIAAASSNSPVNNGQIELYGSASGGTPSYTYSWSGPNAFVSNDQNPIITNLVAADFGTFSVTVTDMNGCTATDTTLVTYNFLCGVSTLTDADNNVYNTASIGNQCWTAENLNTMHSSGNSICYNNQSSNCTTYGRLYDWAAVMDGASTSSANPSGVQGICPTGWHVPSDDEWCELEEFITTSGFCGNTYDVAAKLRATSFSGTDDYGFSALGAGVAYATNNFTGLGNQIYFATSTEVSSTVTWIRRLQSSNSQVYRGNFSSNKTWFHSVRCVKD